MINRDDVDNRREAFRNVIQDLNKHYFELDDRNRQQYKARIEEVKKQLENTVEERIARRERVKCILRHIGYTKCPKAIFRMETKKVCKDWNLLPGQKKCGEGTVIGFEKHMLREINTPNAHPELTTFNYVIKGENSPAMALENFYIDNGLKQYGKGEGKTRIFTELLYTASPEFFLKPGTNEIDVELTKKWVTATTEYLNVTFGKGFVWGIVHFDETTPHIHCCVVGTRYHEKWQKEVVSHSEFFGGKEKLIELQNSYPKFLQGKGFLIERGLKGSKATHKEVSQWRAEQNHKDRIIKEQEELLAEEKKKKSARNKAIRELCLKHNIDPQAISKRVDEIEGNIKKSMNKSNDML